MEIILKEDIVNLGYKNDIVTVKSGYGRNYLIPTGKAVIASPAAKKMLAEELKQRAHKLEKIKKDAEELAAKLEGVLLKIATKVSSTGTIFGSVGNIQNTLVSLYEVTNAKKRAYPLRGMLFALLSANNSFSFLAMLLSLPFGGLHMLLHSVC